MRSNDDLISSFFSWVAGGETARDNGGSGTMGDVIPFRKKDKKQSEEAYDFEKVMEENLKKKNELQKKRSKDNEKVKRVYKLRS